MFFFFFQAEDGIRDVAVTGVQTCALPICIDVKPTISDHPTRRIGAEVKGDGASHVVFEEGRTDFAALAVDITAEVHWSLPGGVAEVIEVPVFVMSARDIEIEPTETAGAVAREIQPVAVGGKGCCLVIGAAVDGWAQVFRFPPRIINAFTLRNIDVKAAEALRAGRIEVKSPAILGEELASPLPFCIYRP